MCQGVGVYIFIIHGILYSLQYGFGIFVYIHKNPSLIYVMRDSKSFTFCKNYFYLYHVAQTKISCFVQNDLHDNLHLSGELDRL